MVKRREKTVELSLNLKPALTKEQLDKRICRDFEKYSRKQTKKCFRRFIAKQDD